MNSKQAVAAFSIIEAIVGMAVTAIIMSIVFVIFSIITERMLDYKNQNQLVNDLNRLTYSLNKDIFDNEKMAIDDHEIVFSGYSGELVKYHFTEEYILRNRETFIDTFKIQVRQMVIDSLKSNTRKKVFLQLKLQVEVNQTPMPLNFYKRVYANELLQTKTQ
ncbi:PulJ/GspJ family protein [Flavobacterium humi]|uniref:Prepilin-type N-terminal cleavage/methylation domain-containing protein n=1 Tax=Flavobacterium humi TaxID=2562683 RepID=A0A4Z0L3Q9_9FLAO|nr:hypothetical protein [Flavobacterium humi]TGD56857.1 hypothetical protein E4635_13740 [Flavobacterium humi]